MGLVTSANPAVARPIAAREAVLARLGSRMATTPGRMRLAAVAILAGLLLLAVVGTGALRARQRATNAVGQQAEPLLVGAEVIYSSLGDADATATNTFLKSGLEPPPQRQQYLDDLATATTRLAIVARQAGGSAAAAQALSVITKDLPIYAGLVEAARANNRLNFPVGAAYLREGSALMQGEILLNVRDLYQVEAGRLDNSFRSGSSSLDILAVVAVAGLALALLLVSQLFVARRTNRLVNVPLAGATLAVIALLGWTMIAFAGSASRLHEARSQGSDPIQLRASTRILLARAQADENLALVARGSGSQYLADFDAVTAALAPPAGLIPKAEQAGTGTRLDLESLFANYLDAHNSVVTDTKNGQFAQAVEVATGTAPGDELPAAAKLSATLAGGIDQAQNGFDKKAAAARHDLSLLGLGVLGLALLAAALTVAGLQQRINEYR